MNLLNNYVAIIGTGYVADMYMSSMKKYAEITCIGAFDIRSERLQKFCKHWNLCAFASIEELLSVLPQDGLVLNLTNPFAHFEVTQACLEAGRHVYSEKPLALTMDEAQALVTLAKERGLHVASAPCSYLSVTAQTLAAAVRNTVCGSVRLVYAELDDGFIAQAPYRKWFSESGANWPYEDEFRSGCTIEHAGYYLTWLIAMFGPIQSITAASAATTNKSLDPPCNTPDVSVGVLFFESGPVVRLTCSIVAPHDHRIKIIGDTGVLEVSEAWDNTAPVRFRKRFTIRRRLLEAPIARRVRLDVSAGRKGVSRKGAASMDFFLGPAEMLAEIRGAIPQRCTPDLALHVTEATLALQNAGATAAPYVMQTRCSPIPPMDWAKSVR